MRIAVSSQNWRTVTSHAGKTRRFLVFEATADTPPVEVDRIDLEHGQALHDQPGTTTHPLFSLNVLITGSAGDRFIQRMGEQGVQVATTSETDPVAAVTQFLSGTLPPAPPHEHGQGHDHEHGQGHGHGHGHGDHHHCHHHS